MLKDKIKELMDVLKVNPKTTQRLNVCLRCPHLQPKLMKCSKCGCFLKLKVRFESEHCPIGKW